LVDCSRYGYHAGRIRRGVRLHDGPPRIYPAARGRRVRRANRDRRQQTDRALFSGWLAFTYTLKNSFRAVRSKKRTWNSGVENESGRACICPRIGAARRLPMCWPHLQGLSVTRQSTIGVNRCGLLSAPIARLSLPSCGNTSSFSPR